MWLVIQVEKLMIAKQHGCYDVIHCDEARQYTSSYLPYFSKKIDRI